MSLQNALLQLPKGGLEQKAIEAGEIDAIVDHGSRNVILFPAARRALREVADRDAASDASIANSLLAALPHADYQRVRAALERITLTSGEVLHEPGVPMGYVYFPVDCVISLLTPVAGYEPLSVGLVGHEGMVGISLALGIDVSFLRALVQGTGTAMRMESGAFRNEILQSKPLQQALYRYEHALLGQIAQSLACNQFHSVQERLARYLLMTGDRAKSRDLRITQQFLAEMLGVLRPSVTIAAGKLEKRKLIHCGRGNITILHRSRLSAASCECYQTIKRIFDSAQAEGADSARQRADVIRDAPAG